MWNARALAAGRSDAAHLAAYFKGVVGLEREHRYALRPSGATCLV
jgi:hypothetical protein